MRSKLVAGNWKMNKTSAEGEALVEQFLDAMNDHVPIDVIVIPPYLSIPRIAEICRRAPVKLGAQDVFWMDEGAFTSRVSAKQLHEFCADYCLVGHSETRGKFGQLEVPETTVGYFAETDETINLKIKKLMYYGIKPILCVGETLAEREAGKTDEIIAGQIRGALDGLEAAELYELIVAYEPVWAIGTGVTCDTPEAQRVCSQVRLVLAEVADADVASNARILYGGSVKPGNALELFSQPDIDGGLVGGASLDPKGFADIVRSAIQAGG